jgi:hypothetical protein
MELFEWNGMGRFWEIQSVLLMSQKESLVGKGLNEVK